MPALGTSQPRPDTVSGNPAHIGNLSQFLLGGLHELFEGPETGREYSCRLLPHLSDSEGVEKF
ncbi:hypothetical protein SDC9_174464 [bioreactor metagenome]|uniref:Uncharacterized protein n=1 Tax=bioreactor metagenome TaxID=1076179 RepID=A0A645GJF5_9ZZZZ